MGEYTSENMPWIAVIEDDVDLAEELIHALEHNGFRCINARTALDAKIKLRIQKFHCIVLDINLEKGTGDDVVRDIRAHSKHENYSTPVVVTSSHLDQGLVLKIRDQIQAALVKPYLIDQLLAKITAVTEKK